MSFTFVLRIALIAGLFLLPVLAKAAGTLVPAGAERVAQHQEPSGSYALPIGPWDGGSMLTRHSEGQVIQTAWRWSGTGKSTLDLFVPLREKLQAEGWSLIYECEGRGCGGFDFRYSTRVLPEPDMHVDLADFRYLAARRGRGEETSVLSLLVSRSEGAQAGFAQTIEVQPATEPPSLPIPAIPLPVAAGEIGAALEAAARVVLPGLSFASGGAALSDYDRAPLQALAAWLQAHPDREVTLVGHSDATGNPESNLTLSHRRAESLRLLMIREFGVAESRLKARGEGDQTPLASNDTAEGRAENRRVEAIVTPTR
ncbi:OmpA family protein [Falsigemmobacter faecalis]|nr:OmpA family protein [Falsigemmobacter faecalis]